jgi:hypothetical protein
LVESGNLPRAVRGSGRADSDYDLPVVRSRFAVLHGAVAGGGARLVLCRSRLTSVSERLDSKLEAEGAEFLVLGLLLVEGIQAMKAYTRFPGYDLLAFNPENQRQARLQVKSRWATDYDRGFLIKNFDSDFVVHVALNRGFRYRRRQTSTDDGLHPPLVYVFPVDVVKNAQRGSTAWSKVWLRDIPDANDYIDKWELVREFLGLPLRA